MTTLATMKERIARELRRTNIDTQIAEAISTAIAQYDGERFYWNESRQTTFSTVVSQEFYTATDVGAEIWKLDYIELYVDDQPFTLVVEDDPERIERLSMNNTQTGQPRYYSYYGNKLRLYPSPDDVYTVRVGGVLSIAAPATDAETGNVWMTTAEYLIRLRAKYEIAINVLHDAELAQYFGAAVEQELERLKKRTAHRVQTGGWTMRPTQF